MTILLKKLRAATLVLLTVALGTGVRAEAADKIPVNVVVVTTFEQGNDTGDTPGEFQNWVERLPLKQTLPFPQGYRSLRYNPALKVLAMVTGEDSLHGAASTMALGMDPRFDLSHAYWVVAGIAGVDPHIASVGSAAWAEWVVDRDLNFEIDPRDAPKDWSTGHVPLGRATPFEKPVPPRDSIAGINAYHLNGALTDWAYRLSSGTKLDDTPALQGIRTGYSKYPNAMKPPFVTKGDDVAASDFWLGDRMNVLAEQWVKYWTDNKGVFAMTAMEDGGIMQSMTLLNHAKRVDIDRVMILRTAANYTTPPAGLDAAQMLAREAQSDGQQLSAYMPSLESAYRVGSVVVKEIAGHWDRYHDHIPGQAAP